MAYSEEKFREAIKEAKIPVLILDNKWHKLFKKTGTTDEIVRLEAELTELLKKQGRLNTELKSIKKLKNDLMNDIVEHMNDGEGKGADKAAAEKKIADNKRLIDEANEKLAAHEDEMIELPREIDRVNRELMLNTMALCYEKLSANTDEIEQISDWIHKIRIELKKQLITKQEKEYYNSELYSFMHDIFGQDVMELFDMRYEPRLRSSEEK
jgi:chromosome segregation ATPase